MNERERQAIESTAPEAVNYLTRKGQEMAYSDVTSFIQRIALIGGDIDDVKQYCIRKMMEV